MKTTIEEKSGALVAIFQGRLDTAASVQTAKDLEPLNDCTCQDIILDCTHLEYISSSGLRLFLTILKNAKPKGSKVFVKGLNGDLKSVFAMTGFINLFEFKE
ncbi:MAG: STAS domain-containing protein [Prevotella sp.]|nr:STAS domain-containing protein [Prevotella sp.]